MMLPPEMHELNRLLIQYNNPLTNTPSSIQFLSLINRSIFLEYRQESLTEHVGAEATAFERYSVRILPESLDVLTEVLLVLHWFFHSRALTISQLGHDRFLPNPLKFICPVRWTLCSLYNERVVK
jgi:hypothetical protein